MKVTLIGLCVALSAAQNVLGQAGEWAQCGGTNSNISIDCASGLTCVAVDESYSQCRAEDVAVAAAEESKPAVDAAGFVGVSGQGFVLDGAKYTVVGTNAYYLAQLDASGITQAWNEIKSSGATVLRTWGFNDVTSAQSYGAYYQVWSGGVGTINTGSNGLGKFDLVVAGAKAAGIRLIVALTNNWGDYGGMDVYVNQIASGSHSNFYTNTRIKDAFKKYINAFVSRYRDEPTIFAWELANEPRCQGCSASTITSWATEISAYIKSIDPNHLVALGDEGFFNRPSSSQGYPYQGGEGIDFEANLRISSIDFGTFHAYPNSWGVTSNIAGWGQTWINDHAAVQKSIGKPVIIEEYGIATSDQATIYDAWWSTILSSGLAGDLYWQAGTSASGSNYDDGNAIFPTESIFSAVQRHSQAMKSRAAP